MNAERLQELRKSIEECCGVPIREGVVFCESFGCSTVLPLLDLALEAERLRAAIAVWHLAHDEWEFLADKGDGMPEDVALALIAAEKALKVSALAGTEAKDD